MLSVEKRVTVSERSRGRLEDEEMLGSVLRVVLLRVPPVTGQQVSEQQRASKRLTGCRYSAGDPCFTDPERMSCLQAYLHLYISAPPPLTHTVILGCNSY